MRDHVVALAREYGDRARFGPVLVAEISEPLERVDLLRIFRLNLARRADVRHDVEHPRPVLQMKLGDRDHLVGDLGDLGVRKHLESHALNPGNVFDTCLRQISPIQLDVLKREVYRVDDGVELERMYVSAPNNYIFGVNH